MTAAVYRKGDLVRIAETPSERVALEFDGFVPEGDKPLPDYKTLQRMAKEAGIPASGTREELAAALEQHDADHQS